jgi:hypothetical protein
MLRAVTKDLASLQALTDADDIFDLVAEDQLEKIRPLLSPRVPHVDSVPDNKAKGLRADPDAHARQAMKSRHAEIVNVVKELERSKKLLAAQERTLRVQMELDRQEHIQRSLRLTQGDASHFKHSEVYDARSAREVPFGHGATNATDPNLEACYQVGAIGGAGRMETLPEMEKTPSGTDLKSWFQRSGVDGVKLAQLLRVCASEYIVCPKDLQDFHENGELAQLFPRRVRVLFHCVEHALRVNGNIPPKKPDVTGTQRAASHVGISRQAGDIWANNDRAVGYPVVVGDPAGGSALLDPVAEAARTDAYQRFEQIASSYPEFMPKGARAPKLLNFGLTQLTSDGERALRNNVASAYTALCRRRTLGHRCAISCRWATPTA